MLLNGYSWKVRLPDGSGVLNARVHGSALLHTVGAMSSLPVDNNQGAPIAVYGAMAANGLIAVAEGSSWTIALRAFLPTVKDESLWHALRAAKDPTTVTQSSLRMACNSFTRALSTVG